MKITNNHASQMTIAASLLLVILSGCASYQLSSEKKSTIVDKISPNVITVTFCGNAYMSQEEVERYTLQRASSEALAKGCSHFVILNKEDKSKICAVNSGMDKNGSYDSPAAQKPDSLTPPVFVEPNATLTIQCIRRGEEIPEGAINAEEFLNKNFPGLKQ